MSLPDSAPTGAVIELRAVPTTDAAPVRVSGYDVARAIAVLGMVMVDVRHELLVYHGSPWLLWLFDAVEGKAAALFVLLAGVGISLRTHRRVDDDALLDRRPLVERALMLIGIGLLLRHLWVYDILHFHGIYLLLAIPLLRAPSRVLWVLAGVAIWIALILNHELDWTVPPDLATTGGVARHVFFNGLYPVFPWIAFAFVGMAVGRFDLHAPATRRRALTIALAIAVITSALDALGRYEQATGALGLDGWGQWLLTWPRAPRPLFVVSGCAIGIAVICGCISLTRRYEERRWVRACIAAGQLSFTIYVGHVVAILVPLEHGFLRGMPIEIALVFAVAMYAGSIAFALWWRRRWPHGPVEGLMRQVTERDRPGPHRDAPLRAR